MTRLAAPRLERLAARRPGAPAAVASRPAGEAGPEKCDLCAAPLGPRHRHLLDLEARSLLCACRPCSLLFDREAAGGGHYRLVPERVLRLPSFHIDDGAWAALEIPVELAFFFRVGATGRIAAFYPGPMGATESLLPMDTWSELENANEALRDMEADVEALLVDRTRGRSDGWLVPVDTCYQLVGLIRTSWKGLAGGPDVWNALDGFFARLEERITGPGTSPLRGT